MFGSVRCVHISHGDQYATTTTVLNIPFLIFICNKTALPNTKFTVTIFCQSYAWNTNEFKVTISTDYFRHMFDYSIN